MQIASPFCGGWRGPKRQITLLVHDQKISDWLIRIMLMGDVETAIRSDIKSSFGIMDFFCTSDAILGLWFSV